MVVVVVVLGLHSDLAVRICNWKPYFCLWIIFSKANGILFSARRSCVTFWVARKQESRFLVPSAISGEGVRDRQARAEYTFSSWGC